MRVGSVKSGRAAPRQLGWVRGFIKSVTFINLVRQSWQRSGIVANSSDSEQRERKPRCRDSENGRGHGCSRRHHRRGSVYWNLSPLSPSTPPTLDLGPCQRYTLCSSSSVSQNSSHHTQRHSSLISLALDSISLAVCLQGRRSGTHPRIVTRAKRYPVR